MEGMGEEMTHIGVVSETWLERELRIQREHAAVLLRKLKLATAALECIRDLTDDEASAAAANNALHRVEKVK